MNKDFYIRNRNRLYELLGDNFSFTIASGLPKQRSEDDDYEFFASRDFVYLTGIEHQNIFFHAEATEGKVSEILYLPEVDALRERWRGRMLHPEDVYAVSGIENYVIVKDGENMPEQEGDIHVPLQQLRTVKSPEEIAAIRKAIARTSRGIDRIYKTTNPGIYEYNIRAEFEKSLADEGCHVPAFATITGAGKNSLCLHYHEADCQVQDGDIVLLDLGAVEDHLNADISRCFPANGMFSKQQRELTQLCADCVDYVCASITPGVTLETLNSLQDEFLAPRLKELGLDGEVKDYRWHNISHHLGWDVHDAMPRSTPMVEGAVFTLEVGVYVEAWGFGIRVEDDVLMTAEGGENLSSYIPRTPDEIEAVMRVR